MSKIIRKLFITNLTGNSNRVQVNMDKYSKISLIDCQFPNCEYNINSYNNILYWKDSTAASLISTTIPVGDYNLTQLVNELNVRLLADRKDVNTYTFSEVQNSSLDSVQQKLQLVSSAGSGSSLYTGKNSILSVLGFNESTHSANTSLVSDNVYNIGRSHYVVKHNLGNTLDDSTFGDKDCFIIPNDKIFGNVINLNHFPAQEIFLRNKIDHIDFTLLDSNYKNISNNNVPYKLIFMLS